MRTDKYSSDRLLERIGVPNIIACHNRRKLQRIDFSFVLSSAAKESRERSCVTQRYAPRPSIWAAWGAVQHMRALGHRMARGRQTRPLALPHPTEQRGAPFHKRNARMAMRRRLVFSNTLFHDISRRLHPDFFFGPYGRSCRSEIWGMCRLGTSVSGML